MITKSIFHIGCYVELARFQRTTFIHLILLLNGALLCSCCSYNRLIIIIIIIITSISTNTTFPFFPIFQASEDHGSEYTGAWRAQQPL